MIGLVQRLFQRATPGRVRGLFRWLQVLSSAFVAFSHGSNDGQKFMGAFTLALVIGGVLPAFQVPIAVILLCAGVMALGTLTGGWRIMRTMGMRITKLQPHQGFCAEMAAATTIELASRLGIPLSTTHTITTAIVGVGTARGIKAVRWGVTVELVTAWILTFPICALTSYVVVFVLRALK